MEELKESKFYIYFHKFYLRSTRVLLIFKYNEINMKCNEFFSQFKHELDVEYTKSDRELCS